MIPTTNQWLDLILAKQNIERKHGEIQALANVLETSRQAIWAQRKYNVPMPPEQAAQIAKLLNIAPIIVISACLYERECKGKNPKKMETWATIYEQNSNLSIAKLAKDNGITLYGT